MPAKIRIDFEESRQFRVVHVDGAFGGPAPTGQLYISLFSEHPPVPKSIFHVLDGNGVGDEITDERIGAGAAVVRVQEVGLMMNLRAAQALHEWIGRHIEILRNMTESVSEEK